MAETHLRQCNQCDRCDTYLDNEELVYCEYGLLCDACLSEINSDDDNSDAETIYALEEENRKLKNTLSELTRTINNYKQVLEEETSRSTEMNKDILNILNIITEKCKINSM